MSILSKATKPLFVDSTGLNLVNLLHFLIFIIYIIGDCLCSSYYKQHILHFWRPGNLSFVMLKCIWRQHLLVRVNSLTFSWGDDLFLFLSHLFKELSSQELFDLARACLTCDKGMQAKNGHVANGCTLREFPVIRKALCGFLAHYRVSRRHAIGGQGVVL